MTTGAGQVQCSPILVGDSFNVDVHLDEFLQDVTVAFVRSVVERGPAVRTFGV